MKKTLAFILCAIMLLSMAACSSKGDESGNSEAEKPGDTMALEEMFDKVLEGIEDLPELGQMAVEPDLFESYLFIQPIDGAEAVVSEAMINAVAHSAVLLRVPEGTDVEAVRAEIETNANPRKWVCVEAEKTAVVANGSTILLVMSDASVVDAMVANFNGLWA